jgi:ATP-dependent exoDNAse (exonuclease V) beta subunit
VTVVGDDAQAIYSFRAAAVENILGFADRYKPKADMVVLAQNYRSTQQILDAANALMADGARQHRKTLLGTRQSTQKPLYVSMDDAQARPSTSRQDFADARNRRIAQAPRHPVPQLAPQRCARSRTHQAQHSLREIRRTEVPRGGARQGHDVGAALGRQSAQFGGRDSAC